MARKPANRPGSAERIAFSKSPVPQREVRRAQLDLSFDNQSLLGALFGQFDANLVQVENRLGVFISARGNELHLEGPEDSVARARDVLRAMYDKLAVGQDLDAGLIESIIAMSDEPTLDGIVTELERARAVGKKVLEVAREGQRTLNDLVGEDRVRSAWESSEFRQASS